MCHTSNSTLVSVDLTYSVIGDIPDKYCVCVSCLLLTLELNLSILVSYIVYNVIGDDVKTINRRGNVSFTLN